MLVIATETFFHDGGLIRPNQKIELKGVFLEELLKGGFVRKITPPSLQVNPLDDEENKDENDLSKDENNDSNDEENKDETLDDKKKEENSSVSQVEEVLTEPTVKKSRTGKDKSQTDL